MTATVIGVLQFAGGVILAWVGWSVRVLKKCILQEVAMVRGEVAELKRRQDEADRQRALRDADVEGQLDAKASREDFIRESARNRLLMERLIEGQARLEGKLDAGTRIAASLERLNENLSGS